MAHISNPLNPTDKKPQTKPGSKQGSRKVRSFPIKVKMPHKGAVRGRKPTLGQRYPRQ